ncbi:Sodium/calcium exchanger protein-domain-containing protein [Rhypophila decipiens]|uniref:Sodium/calcium exchanger protein-domain-containing protein n=1 Tax=Rhypophila decipiens TaxID=261697 RepID=A0AAN6YLE0_9PEZI|nr:Sodium/calcium exchanger protein-domain-containing protein [Rhypophila decipiens]
MVRMWDIRFSPPEPEGRRAQNVTSRRGRRRRRYSARPFIVSLLLITTIAICAFLFDTTRGKTDTQFEKSPTSPLISKRNHDTTPVEELLLREPVDCRAVHSATDQCAFVIKNCLDDEAGLIHYLPFYYCHLGKARPVAFIVLAIWLALLFTTIGIAASDFFSVNLSTIARVLGLSESLAGVTFLAFGNGSPDVFSTFAAMGSNSGSMAVGELLGAAGFITAVVAGSMALVREFKVSKRTFVRDIVFFIAAISFTMVFLADGELHIWECCTMIGFYVFYVIVVVGWHWYTVRQRRRRQKEAAARGHFFTPVDELEPYRDAPDDDDDVEDAQVGGRSSREAEDISALERGPRIEVDGPGREATDSRGREGGSEDDDDETRDIHVAAEMTSSMRVNRPRWGRSNTTITPIRPSLVGALEFRSILSSLNKARNMHLGPVPSRGYTYDHQHGGHHRWNSVEWSTSNFPDGAVSPLSDASSQPVPGYTRERALSSGNTPLNLNNDAIPPPGSGGVRLASADTRASSTARTVDGHLAPPIGPILTPGGDVTTSHGHHLHRHQLQIPDESRFLQIRIPSPTGSGQTSPSLSPFPGLSESPTALTPAAHPADLTHEFRFPVPSTADRRRPSIPAFSDPSIEEPRPVKWWPYQFLPPPHVLLQTLFPTLQGWREKTIWDKALSLVSVPSIFLLVTTLPVVETQDDDDEDGDDDPALVDRPPSGHLGHTAIPVLTESEGAIRPETEWQEYRRRTKSVGSRSALSSRSPSVLDLNHHVSIPRQSVDSNLAQSSTSDANPISIPVPSPPTKPTLTHSTSLERGETLVVTPSALSSTAPDENSSEPTWNRWLVILQLFTGPLFVTFVIWANTLEDMDQPAKTLVRMILYALVLSLSLLLILLWTTSPTKRPRYYFLLCFLGFVISVAWISTIAGEVVGVLKAFGVILDISEAILGLTIFAVGNSLGDLVADVTVARLGYPVMALAACFGGPMLNILLGVGIGGALMGVSNARKRHAKHPDKPMIYRPYKIQVGGTLLVSAITVLLTLIVLLIVVPSNKWVMSRRIGWGLIGIWCVSTAVNLGVEMSGSWGDVSAILDGLGGLVHSSSLVGWL